MLSHRCPLHHQPEVSAVCVCLQQIKLAEVEQASLMSEQMSDKSSSLVLPDDLSLDEHSSYQLLVRDSQVAPGPPPGLAPSSLALTVSSPPLSGAAATPAALRSCPLSGATEACVTAAQGARRGPGRGLRRASRRPRERPARRAAQVPEHTRSTETPHAS